LRVGTTMVSSGPGAIALATSGAGAALIAERCVRLAID